MARRTILAVPIPADVEDVLQILSDVARGWAAAKVETDGSMLTITASRRRAQRPAPDEEPEDDYMSSHPRPVFIPGDSTPPSPEETAAFFNALDPEPYYAQPVRTDEAEPPLSGTVTPAALEPAVRPDPDELAEDEPATAFAFGAAR